MKRLSAAVLLSLAGCNKSPVYELLSPPADAGVLPPGPTQAGPLIAYGGSTQAAVWVAPMPGTSPSDLELGARRVPFPAVPEGAKSTALRLDGLAPGAELEYSLAGLGPDTPPIRGRFRTGPPRGERVRATFAVVSCMNVRKYPNQPAWTVLAGESPSLLIQLGDNTYADGTRPARARPMHFEQRSVPEYRAVLLSTPVIAVWDDHDFKGNNSDATAPEKEISLALFRELFPNPGSGTAEVPGIFFSTDYGDVDIFMLDVRYHRTSLDPPPEARTILGDGQLAWLEGQLRASTATFKLVASGSTLFEGEAWKDFPRDLDRLLGLAREVPGMVFLTGDLHRSSARRHGEVAAYPIYEVVSSGIAVDAPFFSFATLHLDTTLSDPEIEVIVHRVDAEGREVERDRMTIRRSELQAP